MVLHVHPRADVARLKRLIVPRIRRGAWARLLLHNLLRYHTMRSLGCFPRIPLRPQQSARSSRVVRRLQAFGRVPGVHDPFGNDFACGSLGTFLVVACITGLQGVAGTLPEHLHRRFGEPHKEQTVKR